MDSDKTLWKTIYKNNKKKEQQKLKTYNIILSKLMNKSDEYNYSLSSNYFITAGNAGNIIVLIDNKVFGTMTIDWIFDLAARNIALIITSVFPYATSPTIKRSVGYFLLKSSLISSMAEI